MLETRRGIGVFVRAFSLDALIDNFPTTRGAMDIHARRFNEPDYQNAAMARGKRMSHTICHAVSSCMAVSQLSKPVLPTALPSAMPSALSNNRLNATSNGDQRAP